MAKAAGLPGRVAVNVNFEALTAGRPCENRPNRADVWPLRAGAVADRRGAGPESGHVEAPAMQSAHTGRAGQDVGQESTGTGCTPANRRRRKCDTGGRTN